MYSLIEGAKMFSTKMARIQTSKHFCRDGSDKKSLEVMFNVVFYPYLHPLSTTKLSGSINIAC